MGPIWGIDLGGTKIEGVVLEDAHTMRVLRRTRIPTEMDRGYYHVIRQGMSCTMMVAFQH